MSTMQATCLVTIRPHMAPERFSALLEAILNQLWPGNAGGVIVLFKERLGKALLPIVAEVKARNAPARFRINRNGMTYTIEPESFT